jgi:glutamyl-tRNA synthetase
LVLRNEDIDATRYRMEYVAAMIEDLKWFGFDWEEGPDIGGPYGPYNQSERHELYRQALDRLIAGGFVYPCVCTRSDVRAAARAPHDTEDLEPVYGGTCRQLRYKEIGDRKFAWRFRVPDGEAVAFTDGSYGLQSFVAGRDFGDFVVWRSDGVPGYQLTVVVDDAAMRITEVVRGQDLLRSTARQLLLYRAMNLPVPAFCHCPLLCDNSGQRLAKRHDALSLRQLRARGEVPATLRANWRVPGR